MDITPQDLGPLGEPVVRAREQAQVYLQKAQSFPRSWGYTAVLLFGPLAFGVGLFAGERIGWLCFAASWPLAYAVEHRHQRHHYERHQQGGFVEMDSDSEIEVIVERWARRPLTIAEVRELHDSSADALQRSYLDLWLAVLDGPTPADGETQKEVQEAIRALSQSLAGPTTTGAELLPDLRPRSIECQLDALRTRLTALPGDTKRGEISASEATQTYGRQHTNEHEWHQ